MPITSRITPTTAKTIANLFNRGNQATGTQQQALAGSIARFATFVVNNPDVDPAALLGRIAHKHASLGITPEQYEVVHTYLFPQVSRAIILVEEKSHHNLEVDLLGQVYEQAPPNKMAGSGRVCKW